MYSFTFENQGAQTFLVYELKENDVIDTIGMGMMTNNDITGLATMLYTQLNENRYIKYNITSKVSLEQFLTGVINKKRVLGMFLSITEALLALDEYMISIDTVVLEEEYIYIDVTTNKVSLINLPILKEKTQDKDYLEFFKRIMYGVQFDQTENCNYVAKIINFLNGSTFLSLKEFKKLIKNILVDESQSKDERKNNQLSNAVTTKRELSPQQDIESKVQYISSQPSVIHAPISNQQPSVPSIKKEAKESKEGKKRWSLFGTKKKKEKKKDKKKEDVIYPPHVKATQKSQGQVQQIHEPTPSPSHTIPSSSNFGETTVLGEIAASGETTVLSEGISVETTPYLLRIKNNEKIKLVKPVFRIGKEKSYVDYFIGDNTAVSRSHANIIRKENEYYVVDTNSTNHTYVNEKMIESNTEVRLTHGTMLRLANEEFEFKIY